MKINMKNVLIVGGTSGIGLELGKLFYEAGDCVTVTGRRSAKEANIEENKRFRVLQHNLNFIAGSWLTVSTDKILMKVGKVDLLVYAAGFFQDDGIDELQEYDMDNMFSVGIKAPAVYVRNILAKAGRNLPGFIAITSVSQWIPRLKEPLYTAVKAGLYMLANSLSLDERIGKVLVAAPAGVKTDFFKGKKTEEEMKNYLDPKWVADQIIGLYNNSLDPDGSHYEFRFAKILREPPRVKIEETRY